MGRFEYKKIIILGLVCLGLVFVANVALAQSTIDAGFGYIQNNIGMGTQDVRITIANIIRVMMGLLGLAAVIIIIYGAVMYMTSAGELEKIKTAKKLLTGAVIGLVIVLSAFAIASFIISSIQQAAGPGGGGGTTTGPITPPTPPLPPPGFCQDPDATSAAPYICEMSPKQARKGDFVTVKGGKFLEYNETTSKIVLVKVGATQEYTATIASCNDNPSWNITQAVFEVPGDLPFTAGESNIFNVYVVTASGTSKDKPTGGLLPNYKLELLSGEPGPGIACIVPDSGKKDAAVDIYGKRFGATQGTSTLKFSDNISATVTTWSETNLKTTVPGSAQSGEVRATVNNVSSNGFNFNVICETDSDCDSGCCYDSSFGKTCSPANYCLPGPGESCNANTEAGAVCQPTQCQIGSVCDDCVCRYAQAGDPCDDDTVAPGCQVNNNKCPTDNACNPNSCLCEETMVITAVTPNDGAPGNYITISGKGFGQPILGNNVLATKNYNFETDVQDWFRGVNKNLPGEPDITFSNDAAVGKRSLNIDRNKTVSWYFMFGWRNIGPLLGELTTVPSRQYLVTMKYKGYFPEPFQWFLSSDMGDSGNYNGYTYKSKSISQPIPAGTFTDWQTFQGVFTYDRDMADNWYNGRYKVKNIDFGFIAYALGFNIYLDNIEVKEIISGGKVVFCGTDKDGDGNECDDPITNTDDKVAMLPYEVNAYCSVEDAWQNNQIVVVVPSDLNADGPIKVISPSGATDSTNLPPGLGIDNFDLNAINRPGLCILNPKSASFNTYIRAYGTGFGTVRGDVFINNPANNLTFGGKGGWWWTNPEIRNLIVPNLQVGSYSATVRVPGTLLQSNPMNFTVLPVPNAPRIDAIEPVQGQPGQYVTIYGSNLGNQPGLVKFSISGETNKDNWGSADLSFPAQCQNDYWHDSYVVVKVPSSTTGSHDVAIKAAGLFSNTIKFTVCAPGAGTCPLTPGICAISPNQGPVGLSGVTIYGDNFGATQGTNGKVTFYNNVLAPDLSSKWTNNQIGIGNEPSLSDSPIVIPTGAASGPVKVTNNNGNISNGIKFTVSDCRVDKTVCATGTTCCGTGVCQTVCPVAAVNNCDYQWSFTTGIRVPYFGPPYVVEDQDCTSDLQSPSPWISSENNCSSALISASFRQPTQNGEVAANILTSTLTADNISVVSCGTSDIFDNTNCSLTAIAVDQIEIASPRTVNGNQVASQFVLYPAVPLASNTWYKVVLKSDSNNQVGIKTDGDVYLDGDRDGRDGGDYSWNFKVRNSDAACVVDHILVTPASAELTLLTETQQYNAYPVSDNCNILDPSKYAWEWSKKYSDGYKEAAAFLDANHGVAALSLITGQPSYKQLATPKTQGLVYVVGSLPELDKVDDNNQLVVDLNLPTITSFYPRDGINQPEVNSYVTIDGRNFGKTQGTNKVLFGDVEAPLAICDDSWTDTRIKVVVPKVTPVPAETAKTYTLALAEATPEVILNYNFDDEGGVILNDLTGQHQGEIISGAKVDSQFGKALDFNGTNSLVKISGTLNISSGSIEVWFKPDQTQGGTIFSVTNTNPANDFSLNYRPAALGALKTNQWNHLIYTYNNLNTSREIYLNGIRVTGLDSGITVSGNFVGTANTSLTLGAENTGVFGDYFKGQIDNFIIYNKVLTPKEVWGNFGVQPGQILLLNFEEASSEIIDSSGNNFPGLAIANQLVSFRSADGKFGQAVTFNNNNHITVNNNSSLVFDNQITIEGWFKLNSVAGFTNNPIFEANNIFLGIDAGSNLRFEANIGGSFKYASIPLYSSGVNKNIELNAWNYFAGAYDGQKIKLYFNSLEYEFLTTGKIIQQTDFNKACIGGCNNGFKGSLDNFAIYNTALSPLQINSRLGAKDNSLIRVVTGFGEDSTDLNKNGIKDPGETYKYSQNVYPFLCALKPNFGNEGTVVEVIGDNLGEYNKTIYQGKEYGVGSYLKFFIPSLSILPDSGLKTWSNESLSYVSPFKDLATSVINVFVSIDPYSEPYNSTDNLGHYFTGDEFADIKPEPNGDGVYTKENYSVYGANTDQPELASNQVEFYQPPVITSLSPDNGPVEQWVTIYGSNFGETPGTVVFYSNIIGRVIGCPTEAVWHDNYIITEVPEGALTGNLKIITANNLVSNEKLFTVNNKPLGPGLCDLQDLNGETKSVGSNGEGVQAIGVRFESEQGLNNLVFNPSQNAIIADPTDWTDTKIISTIPLNATNGSVYVNKQVIVGQKCVGFSIASWCPSNKYDILFQDVSSNSLPLQLLPCGEPILTPASRDNGFPLSTFTREGNSDTGTVTEFSELNMGNIATDGTYLYTMFNAFQNAPGFAPLDNVLTIYKIGTGYNGTELGRFYKKYSSTLKYYLPGKDSPDYLSLSESAQDSLIYTPDGLYLGTHFHYLKHYWLATTDPLYNKELWGIAKLRLDENTNTYDIIVREIPQGLVGSWYPNWPTSHANVNWIFPRVVLKSTGNNILVPAASPTGFTIQVLDNDWKLINTVFIANARVAEGKQIYNLTFFEASYPSGVADDQNIYFTGRGLVSSVNWRTGEWVGSYYYDVLLTKNYNGAYDWVNNKYWFGVSNNDDPSVSRLSFLEGISKHNRIYRYTNCPLSVLGFCRADSDCTRGRQCPKSICQNGQCTPQITSFTPTSGPIGKWVNIYGCNFGCTPGQVYFTGSTSAGVEGLKLADPICNVGSWSCKTDNTLDNVLIEVPNRFTATDITDDALTGPIRLVTNSGLSDSSADLTTTPDFTVNQDVLGPQICRLIPNYGNRGINVRIYGENFGETPATDDKVTFEPTADIFGEPFFDYGSDGLPDTQELEYDPINNPDPTDDNFSDDNLTGTEKNNIYDIGESYTDINGDGVYTDNLNKNNYSFTITDASTPNFVNQEEYETCPADDGWDGKNICFEVPITAAGTGTSVNTALNNVAVTKGALTSNDSQFNLNFGSCGNQKIEADLGEMCDGDQLPTLTESELLNICKALFPSLPQTEKIENCIQSCDSNCESLFCIGNECKKTVNLCGNGIIDGLVAYSNLRYEQCDGKNLNNHTCTSLGQPSGTLSCYDPTSPRSCMFNYSKCIGESTCTADSDCNACGAGTSTCVKGFCTPYISSFTPTDGKISTWTTLTGCYFGCDTGKVYFQGDRLSGLPVDLRQGLLAGYLFEADEPTKDISSNNFSASLNDGASVQSGVLSLDGSDDDLNMGNLGLKELYSNFGNETAAQTFIAKIKWTAPTGAETPVLGIYIGALELLGIRNGRLSVYGTDGTQWVQGPVIRPEVWTDIAIVALENSGIKFYVDGILYLESSRPVKFINHAKTTLLGEKYTTSYANFSGQIDHVLVYSRALADNEIANIYKLTHREGLDISGACPENWMCHKSCSDKFCVGGDNDNKLCTTDASCPGGSCLSNSRECSSDDQCKVCLAGEKAGDLCSTNEDCPFSQCGSGTCRADGNGDKAIVEVPNINTSALEDDARTGPINLVTSNSLQTDTLHLSPSDFTISDTVHPQICIEEPGLKVQSTAPADNAGITDTETAVCRNAKINIYFDKIVNEDKVTKGNFILQTCTSGVSSVALDQGLIKNVWNYVSNIFQKLAGVKNDVFAADCTTVVDYSLEVENTNTSKVSIIPEGLLAPEQVYVVQIRGDAGGITSSDGGILDITNSPKKIDSAPDYVFEFKTLGQSGDNTSGICNVDWIDVIVYRTSALNTGELRNNDLFTCSGNDCKSAVDYDQDDTQAGNQHIYQAKGMYDNGIELQANFKWSKSDISDPQRAISISNTDTNGGDSSPDDYLVSNTSGYVNATPASIKEAVAKLVIEAQANWSSATPVQRDFNVYVLLCANPWPGIDEKFPISSIINAYNFQTYYCRDAGRPGDTSDDLPAARWLAPKEERLNTLLNTDFEFGNLSYWNDITGTAFNSQPVFRDLPRERGGVSANIQGAWWVNTYERYRGQSWENIYVVQGNTAVGILQSSAFKIEGTQLKFRLGGDNHPWPQSPLITTVQELNPSIGGVTAAVLFVRDNNASGAFTYALSATGDGRQVMSEKTWDVSTLVGKTGIIYIYDNNPAGSISFDDLRQYGSNGAEIPIRF